MTALLLQVVLVCMLARMVVQLLASLLLPMLHRMQQLATSVLL